ncbi:MmpS family transport accessory protein [Nocardia sp. NPDC057440]
MGIVIVGLRAQTNGTSVTCRVTGDGKVTDEKTATGKDAAVECSGSTF